MGEESRVSLLRSFYFLERFRCPINICHYAAFPTDLHEREHMKHAKENGGGRMKSKIALMILMLAMLFGITPAVHAQVKITAEHNSVSTATKAFTFKTIPPPASDDAASKAKLVLVDGELDPNGADLSALT